MMPHKAIRTDDNQVKIVLVNLRQVKERVMPMTMEQYDAAMTQYHEFGALIQNAFPFLSDDDREFMISGCTPEEFDALFSEEEVR